MKILTIIGARPQFIKAAMVSRAIAAHNQKLKTKNQKPITEVILHTGQHFDANMSEIFFRQMGIPEPDYLLDIHGGSHGEMTGRMLTGIEKVILKENPDYVLVYGDTNSTLAGALAAAKLHVPVAHVEAGLRSYNRRMPEEINRILTDQLSTILFCPTDTAINNLKTEGFPHRLGNNNENFPTTDQKPKTRNQQLLINVGDVMQDAALFFGKQASKPKQVTHDGDFVLATLHRAENTDDPVRLRAIVSALNEIHSSILPVILPLHPRTRNALQQGGLSLNGHVIEPVGYLEMLWLLKHCSLVVTDSGGVQKEAFFFAKPCVTTRDQTEWVELVEAGANCLVGADERKILDGIQHMLGQKVRDDDQLYGGGEAAEKVVNSISQYC
jgi:UDP-GlcNAc3NAcA epimerase